jgi:hypothetical protein
LETFRYTFYVLNNDNLAESKSAQKLLLEQQNQSTNRNVVRIVISPDEKRNLQNYRMEQDGRPRCRREDNLN